MFNNSNNYCAVTPYTYTGVREYMAWNRRILCTPFETLSIELENKGKGFAIAKERGAPEGLKVIIGTSEIPAGAIVYLRADCKGAVWAKEIFSFGQGEGAFKFIVVPEDQILWVERDQKIQNYWTALNTDPPSYSIYSQEGCCGKPTYERK